MKIVVVDGYTLNPGDLNWSSLDRLGDCTVYDRSAPEDVISRCREADIVLTNKVVFDAVVLKQLPRLRYLGVLATGYNVVDVSAAFDQGVVVTNIPAYGTDSVAQFVLTQILNWAQPLQDYASTSAEFWPRSVDFCYYQQPLTELSGKTLGIIGYGEIGSRVATLAGAFGMQVLVHTRTPRLALPSGCRYAPLDELLPTSDVVSLHCPLSEHNAGMVDKRFLSLMKAGALLINTARGGLVNEADLRTALVQNWIGGAALDVLSAEPPAADHPLLGLPNCRITPHVAWATHEARERLMAIAVSNVVAFLSGQPVNQVKV